MKQKTLKAFSLILSIENEIFKLRVEVRKQFNTDTYKRIYQLKKRKERVNNIVNALNAI